MIIMTAQNDSEYAFFLWIEYCRMCSNWFKWWEDLIDLYFYKKISED